MQEKTLMTKQDFQSLCRRHNFNQAESGAHQLMNEIIQQELEDLMKQCILQAEHNQNSTLQKKHLLKVLENSREIPKGIYHSNHFTGP